MNDEQINYSLSPYYIDDLNYVAEKIALWRSGKGFKTPTSFAETDTLLSKLALVHEEVSEAVTEVRKGTEEAFLEELADVVIRILDLAGTMSLDLAGAIEDKMLINEIRPYLHGKRA